MIQKNWQGTPPDPAWVEKEIARLSALVDRFAAEMKARLAAKAQEGWTGWDDPSCLDNAYTSLLAQAAAVPRAAGQEADIANYAMILWYHRACSASSEAG